MRLTNIIRKTLQLLLLMLITNNAFGHEVNTTISKEEIIEKAWKAMFGDLKSEDVKSIYIEIFDEGDEVPNKTTIKRPNYFRNVVKSGILVFDGKRAAWAERKPDKEGNPRHPEIIEKAHWLHFEAEIALYMPAIFDYSSEFKGMTKYEGTNVYEFFIELPMGAIVSYFIDSESFLISRMLMSYSGDPKDYSDLKITNYIDYNGILFPDGFNYGKKHEKKRYYKNVKFNINPNEELFKVPTVFKHKYSQRAKDEIINKVWKAMFGELKSKDIESISVDTYYHGREIPSKVTIQRPNHFRNVIKNSTLVFDGERAADIDKKPDAEGNPQESEILESYHWRHFEVDIALIFPAIFEYPSELKGITMIKGIEYYEFYVELPLGANMTYLVDSKSYLITRRIASYSGEATDKWEMLISNYTEKNGILFAEEITFEGQDGMEKAFYKNVKFNVNPTKEMFEIPKELK